jgi:hypothetical protein
MKKEYILGGLALFGVIAIVSYLQKPKKNSEGFFNAMGKDKKKYYCRNERGQIYMSDTRDCKEGYRAIASTVGN